MNKTILKLGAFFVVVLLLLSCSSSKKAAVSSAEKENIDNMVVKEGKNKTYEYVLLYVDLNNNTYYIKENKITYSPISPMESSSGTYSGGDPWEKEIDNEVYFEIENTFKNALNKKENHLEKRERISVLIKTKHQGKEEKSYILKPNHELDGFMKSIKNLETLRGLKIFF